MTVAWSAASTEVTVAEEKKLEALAT